MGTWEWMAKWMSDVYSSDQLRQSAHVAGNRLPVAEQAWKQFCLIPIDFLETPSGQTDYEVYRSLNAFLMYHWDAGHTAGLSLGNALSGHYNVAFTLLRSFTELVLNGALFQCLAQRRFRESPRLALEPIDSLRMLITHLSTTIREEGIDDSELESNSIAIFNILRGDWMQYAFHLSTSSIIQQLADWGVFNHLGDNSVNIVKSLYFELSRSVHERVEYTDAGRAIEEGKEIFEWPAPILAQSLSEVLNDFHLAMEIGIIMLLNLFAGYISPDQLSLKCQQLLSSEAFKLADLKQATKLLKRWSM